MAALNSLPVINPQTGSKPSVSSRPSTPSQMTATGNSHLDPNFHKSLFPSGTEEFGASLTQMGYDKIIVAKAIQLFGKDEHKCIGTDFQMMTSSSRIQYYVFAIT